MLTREKARKQPCKPNDAITLLTISFMAAQYKDSELSESQKEDLDKIYGAAFCTANDCPHRYGGCGG